MVRTEKVIEVSLKVLILNKYFICENGTAEARFSD
jgi:hypothetical protein